VGGEGKGRAGGEGKGRGRKRMGGRVCAVVKIP